MSHRFRDPVSGFTHLFAAIGSGFGLGVLLYLGWGQWVKWTALLIYGLSLILMFSASALYHLVKSSPNVILWLRKLDHSAIYLLIAGTYTPICLHYFSGFWRWGLLGIIWTMALTGISIKLFIIKVPRWVNAGIYLVMGWMAVMGMGEIFRSMPPGAIIWLLTGGLFFTAGAIIYILKRPNFVPGVFGFHELWHIFVILGALSHFITIAGFVAAA